MSSTILKARLLVLVLSSIILYTTCTTFTEIIESIAEAGTPPDLGWASRRDFTGQQFQQYFNQYNSLGWIMKDIDIYPDGSSFKFSMIWEENRKNLPWEYAYGVTANNLNTLISEKTANGLIFTDIEAYQTSQGMRYAGIWEENVDSLSWIYRRDLNVSQYGDFYTQQFNLGMRLVDVEVYETNGGLRYACIWHENKAQVEWKQFRDMPADTYQQRVDQMDADRFKMVDIESYTDNGTQKYAAIWEKNLFDHAAVSRSDLTEVEYSNYWRLHRDEGYRIIDFERYETSTGSRYAGVWIENSPRFQWEKKHPVNSLIRNYRINNNVPGVSCAIIHEGRLVYQRGFGMAETDEDKEAHGRSVYRIASISKIVGGTLAAKLESEGQLADGTNVNLNLDLPTTSYLSIPANGHNHTVRQLLSHTACIWHYGGGPTPNGHFATAREAVEDLWDESPMEGCTIGVNRNYSSHAFTFIGAVLESATGRSVSRLVEEEIAGQYNLNSLKVQFRNSSLRPNYERVAAYDDDGDETSYDNNSWKVLGGGLESDAVDLAWFGWMNHSGTMVTPWVRDNRLWTPVSASTFNGYGWEVQSSGFGRVAQHGGSATGARCRMRVYRDADLVIVVLSNSRINDHEPYNLITDIADEVLR